MGDALNRLAEEAGKLNEADRSAESGEARVRREYAEWITETALPAFEAMKETLYKQGIEASAVGPMHDPPELELSVLIDGRPPFAYRLFLHPRTGSERALVMKRYTIVNPDWHPDPSFGQPKRIITEEMMLFNQANNAKDITRDQLISDATNDYLSYRRAVQGLRL